MFSGIEAEAVEVLLRGQGCAKQLKKRLHDTFPFDDDGSVRTVIDSFSRALSLLTNTTTSDHMPRRPSKRNREMGEVSSTHDSPIPNYHDGFAWRKYGQKTIKTSPHQRSYYRCTYMEQCNAKKHVQRVQDNPPLYRTTYFGRHTCPHDPTHWIISDSTHHDDYKMIRFDKLDQPVSSLTGPVKSHPENLIIDSEPFLVDDVQLWPFNELPPLSCDDVMIGSSSSFETSSNFDHLLEHDDLFQMNLIS